MEQYKAYVRKRAEEKSNTLIPNGGIQHAEVLIESLFGCAEDTVSVFTGGLNSQVYATGAVLASVKRFLSVTSHHLNILIQEKEKVAKNNELITLCEKTEYKSQCTIKYVTNSDDADVDSHFVVADDFAYRLEPDRLRPTAVACFNGKDISSQLNTKFTEMFDRGEEKQAITTP